MNDKDGELEQAVGDQEKLGWYFVLVFIRVVLVISFFFCGVFQIVLGFQGSVENRRLRQACTVASTAIKTEEKRGSVKGLRGTENYCDYIYVYNFEGREYTAKWRIIDSDISTPDIVDIFIDPERPSQYRIIGNERDNSGNYRFGAFMLSLSFAMSIIFRLIAKKGKQKS